MGNMQPLKLFQEEQEATQHELRFRTCTSGGTPTEKIRILANGGLTFNGDTAQANALDDYEEGSF